MKASEIIKQRLVALREEERMFYEKCNQLLGAITELELLSQVLEREEQAETNGQKDQGNNVASGGVG